MRKFFAGVFFIIAASAAIAFFLSLIGIIMKHGMSIDLGGNSRSAIPSSWKALVMYAVVGIPSGAIGAIFISEGVAAYYRKHLVLRWGTFAFLILLGHRVYWEITYAAAGGRLEWAAANGDIEMVEELLAEGKKRHEIREAWMGSVFGNRPGAARVLVPYLVRYGDVCHAFFFAASHSNNEDQAIFLKILVEAGADPKDCPENDFHYNAYIYARPDPTPVMKYLLEQGVEPGEKLLEELALADPKGYWDHVREVLGIPQQAEATPDAVEPIETRHDPTDD